MGISSHGSSSQAVQALIDTLPQKDEMAEGAFFPAAITENGLSRHVLILRMK